MKKNTFLLSIVLIFFVSGLTIISCKKETTTPTICDAKGTYSGTSLSSLSVSSTMTYKLQDNNFAIGSVTPSGASVSFGGYRNTCDSVVLSVYYTTNSSYYLLQGKLSNSGATISGTYKNLTTTSDIGTFTISK